MQENIYYTQDGLVQPSLRGTIEYDHTDFMLFHTIRKQHEGGKEFEYDEEAQRYIDIHFRQSQDNWHVSESEGRFKHERIPAKKCSVEDFLSAFDDPDD